MSVLDVFLLRAAESGFSQVLSVGLLIASGVCIYSSLNRYSQSVCPRHALLESEAAKISESQFFCPQRVY